MPRKKKSEIEYVPEVTSDFPNNRFGAKRLFSWPKIFFLVVLFFIIDSLLYGWPIVAMVNQKPILRWQLISSLQNRFGQQALEQMITEYLITQEAQKNNISISQTEIEAKTTEITKGLGENINLEELLKFQGLSKNDFENQLRLQLTVSKILGKDVAIEDKDIDEYLLKNRTVMTATEEGALKEEARQAIMDQKISEKLQPWFLELKEKAKIFKFL